MTKPMVLVSSLVLLFSQATFAAYDENDEYDYIPVPLADQSFDLLDDDVDGVINARDLCAATPRGSELDNDGCEAYIDTSQSMALRILFDNNSTVIKPVFQNQIAEMARFLQEYPSTSIEIEGYASALGDQESNLVLSENRAKAVRQALINYGISADRLAIIGFGETKPEVQGDSPFAYAVNRKVVASVIGFRGEVGKEWTIFDVIPD
ncbi:OmpA family protein [Vibrio hippocampi]|nr:OmpA family protein [Vibrio hippocampi]